MAFSLGLLTHYETAPLRRTWRQKHGQAASFLPNSNEQPCLGVLPCETHMSIASVYPHNPLTRWAFHRVSE